VMEYAACGDLYSHIVSAPNGKLSEKEAREIFLQASEGIQYLHRSGYIHRDIKPENILLGKGNHVYIADLGFGTVWEKNKITNTPCGSLYYASPEIVRHDGVYVGPEVDVWSLGCVLYVMAAGRLPFHGNSADSTRKLIIRGEFDVPYHFSADLKQLLYGMLDTDPAERIDMDKVTRQSWVVVTKPGPKRALTRRRSIGSSFASFMGALSFGSKSKDDMAESANTTDEKESETGKDKDKEKEKHEKPKKEKKRRLRHGRRNSDAPPPMDLFEDKPFSTKGSKNAEETKEAEPKKTEKKRGSKRNSLNMGKLPAIFEEGESGGVSEKEEPLDPHETKAREKDSDAGEKKKRRGSKKMTSSYQAGDAAWGLPVISEEGSTDKVLGDGRKISS